MVEVNNLTASRIDTVFLKNIGQKVLAGENKGNHSLSIALIGKEEMKRLNERYRNKKGSTDVLSFAERPEAGGLKEDDILGEVVICVSDVEENAEKLKVPLRQELAKVLIHGTLHVLGYDHEGSKRKAELMRDKEDYYLSNIHINNAKGKHNN